MSKSIKHSAETAEVTALSILAFLAADEQNLARFLSLSGLNPQHISSRAKDHDLLSAILDYIMSDEALLLACADYLKINPESILASWHFFNKPYLED